jgi:hypothetical protein
MNIPIFGNNSWKKVFTSRHWNAGAVDIDKTDILWIDLEVLPS